MSLERGTGILKNIIEKLKNLEAEKKSLLIEIGELKEMADAKATALESEVNALMDEVRTLRVLMYGAESSGSETGKQNTMAEDTLTELESEPDTLRDRARYKGSFVSLKKNSK